VVSFTPGRFTPGERTLGTHWIIITIPGNRSVDPVQETAVQGTSHIIRKVLQFEWWGVPLVQEEMYQVKGNL
jgi:hypothetical protein